MYFPPDFLRAVLTIASIALPHSPQRMSAPESSQKRPSTFEGERHCASIARAASTHSRGDASVGDGHCDPLVFVPEGDLLHLAVHPAAAVGVRLRDLGQRGAPAVKPPDAVGLLRVQAGRHLSAYQS